MKQALSLLLLLLSFYTVHAQEKKEDTNQKESDFDGIIDSLFEQDEEGEEKDGILEALFKEQKEIDDIIESYSNFQFLYFSLNYNSNTFFSGKDLGTAQVDQYNIRPQITYMNSKGFFVGLSGIYYDQFKPQWDFTAALIGYGKSIGEKKLLRLTGTYSRFFYAEDADNSITNSLSFGISLRNSKRTLGTRLSSTYSFGGGEGLFQMSLSSYGVFKLIEKKDYRLQFRPLLNFTAGDQVALVEDGTTFFIDDIEFLGLEEKKTFDLINVQLSLPFIYSNEKWDFELGYNINFPNESRDEEKNGSTGFFNVSVAYLLEI